jgi:hypothetical protein
MMRIFREEENKREKHLPAQKKSGGPVSAGSFTSSRPSFSPCVRFIFYPA